MSFTVIGAIIGFFSSGIYGAIIGAGIGYYIDRLSGNDTPQQESRYSNYGQSTNSFEQHPVDFKNALLILIAAVMRADGKALKSELDMVKQMLLRTYGENETKVLLLKLREYLQENHNLNDVCRYLRNRMGYSPRLELVHVLFRISRADGEISSAEINLIQNVATQLGITTPDYLSLRAMFVNSDDSDYKILDISSSASEDEVKKAYRKLAMRFHPDRLQDLSANEKKQAEEKFHRVQNAYDSIKKRKGWS